MKLWMNDTRFKEKKMSNHKNSTFLRVGNKSMTVEHRQKNKTIY